MGYSFLSSVNLHMLEILLAQGADPNETYEGVPTWQYWVCYMHCEASYLKPKLEELPVLKRIFKRMLSHDVALHVCCMMDSQIWENVYPEQETRGNRDFRSLRRHLMDHGKKDAGIRDESLESSFEEIHSLSAVFTDIFNTEQDPHGADELLEYIAMLKDLQESGSHGGASVGQTKKKKKNRKKGKNSGA
jgi:hypothetical protein